MQDNRRSPPFGDLVEDPLLLDMRRAELRQLQVNADTDNGQEFSLQALALAFDLGYARQTAS